MVEEILSEIAAEISAEPLKFLLELLQFGILLLLIYAIAWGFGLRRGFLRNMLTERAAKLDARLSLALHSGDELEHAKQLSALRMRTARSEGRDLLAEARRQAAELTSHLKEQTDSEADRVLARVDEALETEMAEMKADVREQLVDLVAQSTRQVLNERLTVAEQRQLIEEHIIASVTPEGNESPGVTVSQGA